MKTKSTKKGFRKRLQEAIIHLFGGIMVQNCVESSDEMERPYLFNFTPSYSGGWDIVPTNPTEPNIRIGGDNLIVNGDAGDKSTKKVILPVKPIDVLHELETIPTPFSVENIDEKIAILKDKADLIQQQHANREVNALIDRMENRKQYAANRAYFEQYQNTTDEKIAALLKKYPNLRMKDSDIFIPEFPDVAIKIMKAYKARVKKISGKSPVFMVIAPEDQFKKAYEKRDPILLVQSPFGFYWQILGAWDTEMVLLSEL